VTGDPTEEQGSHHKIIYTYIYTYIHTYIHPYICSPVTGDPTEEQGSHHKIMCMLGTVNSYSGA
jgi:hypothetical protein